MTSGEQVGESEFEIDTRPGSGPFLRWVDRLIKDNGELDCLGFKAEVGHVATNYIYVVGNDRFVVCREQNTKKCSQLFVRQGKD